jgi:phage-related protein
MITWTLWQYRNIAESFLTECAQSDTGMHEEILIRLGALLERGNGCKRPISEFVEDGLFALRGKSKTRQARLMYYFGENRQIIFVHAFYKTTRKISRQDIEMAKRNRHLIEEGRERRYGFYLTA